MQKATGSYYYFLLLEFQKRQKQQVAAALFYCWNPTNCNSNRSTHVFLPVEKRKSQIPTGYSTLERNIFQAQSLFPYINTQRKKNPSPLIPILGGHLVAADGLHLLAGSLDLGGNHCAEVGLVEFLAEHKLIKGLKIRQSELLSYHIKRKISMLKLSLELKD